MRARACLACALSSRVKQCVFQKQQTTTVTISDRTNSIVMINFVITTHVDWSTILQCMKEQYDAQCFNLNDRQRRREEPIFRVAQIPLVVYTVYWMLDDTKRKACRNHTTFRITYKMWTHYSLFSENMDDKLWE